MATINNAPALIDAPPPPPRPYGLFDVALGPMPFPVPEAVGGGLQYVPDDCVKDIFMYQMNCPAVSGSKTFSVLDTPISGSPFGIITSYVCGSIGFSFDEAAERVRTRMTLREQRGVERRVWQGWDASNGLGTVPGLFRSATDLGTSGCVTEAVEMLEQALADNGIVGGAIHARPGMSAHLSNNYLVYEGPGRLKRTVYGTPYVFGQGYDGSGPAGQAATGSDEYMYASGRVLIWGTDIAIPDPQQTMDRALNQMYVLGEKVYLAVVECGSWAVKVTRTCTTAGGGT
jgi:hypothetical protein